MIKLNKKVLLAATSLSLLLNGNVAYAASESGDAVKPEPTATTEKMKAKLYDYEDNKDYIKGLKSDKDDNKMIFTNDTGNKKLNDINRWDNSPNVYNNELKKNQHYKIVEGLVKDQLDENGNIETNYTVLSNNEATTLYTGEFTDYEIEFTKDENGVYTFNDDRFLPLGNDNFLFGMSFGFDFTLSDNREGMVFNFAGDDDVWIFIDGELVLDLGGIHSKVSGSIDFNNNTVSRTGQFKNGKNQYGGLETKLSNLFIANGKHTLKMFYLERGANNSRCGIQFKLEDVKPIEEKEEPSPEPEEKEEPSPEPEQSEEPSAEPEESEEPEVTPTVAPTVVPTEVPTVNPTVEPTTIPEETVDVPTVEPTDTPNFETEADTIKEETPDVTYDVVDKGNFNNNKKATLKTKVTNDKDDNNDFIIDESTPQTGDNSYVTMAVITLVISLIATAITLVFIKKREGK